MPLLAILESSGGGGEMSCTLSKFEFLAKVLFSYAGNKTYVYIHCILPWFLYFPTFLCVLLWFSPFPFHFALGNISNITGTFWNISWLSLLKTNVCYKFKTNTNKHLSQKKMNKHNYFTITFVMMQKEVQYINRWHCIKHFYLLK